MSGTPEQSKLDEAWANLQKYLSKPAITEEDAPITPPTVDVAGEQVIDLRSPDRVGEPVAPVSTEFKFPVIYEAVSACRVCGVIHRQSLPSGITSGSVLIDWNCIKCDTKNETVAPVEQVIFKRK